jgi:hypothetical protein
MKNLFLSLVLVMVGLVANSQVITVKVTTSQNFSHPSLISTVQAMKDDVIEYPYHIVGENIYTFNLKNKTVTLENSEGFFSCEIKKITKNSNVLDCIVFDGTGDVLFLLGETSSGETQFLHEFIENGKVFGEFSVNGDFSYTIK